MSCAYPVGRINRDASSRTSGGGSIYSSRKDDPPTLGFVRRHMARTCLQRHNLALPCVPRSLASLAIFSVVLALTACVQRQERPQANLTVDPSFLISEYGIAPARARLLAKEVNEYLRIIGGSTAFEDVLLKIGARPSPESVHMHAGLLALRGAVRRGKAAIDSLAFLRSYMFQEYGRDQCDVLVGAPQTAAADWTFMASLDSTFLTGLFDFYGNTTLAEINETGSLPTFDRARLVAAWRSFYAKLPTSESDRFIHFLDAPAKSVEEECWFQRHFWTLLPELPEEDARVIMWQIATNKFQPRR